MDCVFRRKTALSFTDLKELFEQGAPSDTEGKPSLWLDEICIIAMQGSREAEHYLNAILKRTVPADDHALKTAYCHLYSSILDKSEKTQETLLRFEADSANSELIAIVKDHIAARAA